MTGPGKLPMPRGMAESPLGGLAQGLHDITERWKATTGHVGAEHFGWSSEIAEWGAPGYPVGVGSHLYCGCGELLFDGRTGALAEPGVWFRRRCDGVWPEGRCGRNVAAQRHQEKSLCGTCTARGEQGGSG